MPSIIIDILRFVRNDRVRANGGASTVRKPIRSTLGGLASALVLAGCAVPAALSIASFAFDGASYVATGKSVRDHAISVVVDEDCALWRAVAGRPVCQETSGPIVAFLPSEPILQPERSRDGTVQPDGLTETPPAKLGSEAPEDEQPVDVAVNEGGATAEELLALVEERGGATEPGETDAMAAKGPALVGALAAGAPAYQTVATDERARGRVETKLRPTAASSPALRLAGEAPDRRDRAAEVKRILAAKAEGITPHALTAGGEWRPIDSGRGVGLVRALDSVLTSISGSPKPKDGAAIGGSGVYLVFGTFTDSMKAAVAARRYADFTTRVLRDSREGRSLYRVVAGPYQAGEAHSVREAVAQNGAPHVWLLRL
jgi:hypothetical protein